MNMLGETIKRGATTHTRCCCGSHRVVLGVQGVRGGRQEEENYLSQKDIALF